VVDQLTTEYAGQPVVFMEQDADDPVGARYSRWWAAHGGGSVTLPLVMVDSGNQISNGYVDFYNVYKSMIDTSLARPAQAEIQASSRRSGDTLHFEVQLMNLSGVTLDYGNGATLHALVYEDARVGLTDHFVRAATSTAIPGLAHGETTTLTLETDLSGVDWDNIHAIVLADYRPGGSSGAYDMLQAATADLAPTLISIEPASGPNSGSVHITDLAGSYFRSGAAVKLARSGQADIGGTNTTVVSATRVTCDFDLTGAAAGAWDVILTNPDGQSATLVDGFNVIDVSALDVSIHKQVIGRTFEPGDPITFTLTVANVGNKVASHVVVTDVLPSQVQSPTFASTFTIVDDIAIPPLYAWQLEPLEAGVSGVITISGQITGGMGVNPGTTIFPFVNTASISDPEDDNPDNNTSSVVVGGRKVYLPLLMRGL
jgi:uncharacterized repeat protein (TIGR01451 family)